MNLWRRRLALLLCLLPVPAAGADGCRLALVLALDVSASVDAQEDALQRGGLARALIAPEVEEAFLAEGAPVWLTVFEWSGPRTATGVLDWLEIASPEDLQLAAAAIAGSKRSRDDMPTALGYALGYAAGRFQHGPDCDAQTVDVSGDGRNNEGFPPTSAYGAFPFDGVTVNGLAIAGGESGIADYYRDEMIRGPGAFVIVADGFDDYERAMRAKLLRELRGPVIGWLAPGGPG